MKRNLVFILSAVMTAGMLLAGCGNSAPPPASEEKPAATEAPQEEPATTEAPQEKPQENSAGKTIIVACSGTAVPYSYVEDDVHKGFEVDMWNEISALTGYEIEMVTTGFSSIFGMLDSGQVDVAGNFFGMSQERMEKYDVSIPYGADSIRVAVDKDNAEINSFEDLKGKKVSVSEGTQGMSVALEESEKYGYEVVVYGAEGTTAMQELSLGRVDAWIESEITVSLDSEAAGLDFKVLDGVLTSTNVGYFVKKNNAESVQKLADINSALEKMLSDGTVSQISERWFYTDVTANIK